MYCAKCGKQIPDESSFCLACGSAVSPVTASHPTPPPKTTPWRAVVLALVLVVVGCFYILNKASRPGSRPLEDFAKSLAGRPRSIPVSENLVSGNIVVSAGRIHYVRFKVDTITMHEVRVVGRYSASGGSGNDIQVVLATEDEFENWKNGHQARVLYGTDKITVGSIDTPVRSSGDYCLAFSNAFSAVSSKNVTAEVKLIYKRLAP